MVSEFVKKFSLKNSWNSPICSNNTALRRRIKGLMLSNKQFSLDSRMDLIATANIDDSEVVGSKLKRNSGSVKEKKGRKQQTRVQQVIPFEGK